MGNMCSSQYQTDSQQKRITKIVKVNKTSSLTHTDCSQPKLILQSLQNQMENYQVKDGLTDFQIVSQLGKGGQADIFQIKFETPFLTSRKTLIKADETYALKRIYKNNILNRIESLQLSKKILTNITCPFLINGLLLSEDENFYYQVLPNAIGGDAASFLSYKTSKAEQFRRLGQNGIRFILAGVLLALQQIHNNNIIYCDLKLENILIGSDGYPLLTDFQMSYPGKTMKTDGFRGTRTYVAPQVLLDNYVNQSIDIWALGVTLYALTYGQTPYAHEEIKDHQYILKCQNNQNRYRPQGRKVSNQLNSLINSLLRFKPSQRLADCSFGQIKSHNFFRNFDWSRYSKKQLVSPLEPIVSKYNKLRISQIQRSRTSSPENSPTKTRRKISADRETACDQFAARLQQLYQIEQIISKH